MVTPPTSSRPAGPSTPSRHAGKAVVLRLDNSATAMQIREDNKKVSTNAGKTSATR